MYSMTGFGRGESKEGGVEVTVEIKTVFCPRRKRISARQSVEN